VKKKKIILAIALGLGGININATASVLSPILSIMQQDYGISDGEAGFLTTILLVVCAIASIPIGKFVQKAGIEVAFASGLLGIAIGDLLRTMPSYEIVIVGSVLCGYGMIAGNVCLPLIVIRDFSTRINAMNSYYAGVMTFGAFVMTATAAQIAAAFGWRMNMYMLSVIALLSLIYWVFAFRVYNGGKFRVLDVKIKSKTNEASNKSRGEVHKFSDALVRESKIPVYKRLNVWLLIMVLSLNSFAFFSFTALLPKMITQLGIATSSEEAGMYASVFQVIGIVGTIGITLTLKSFLKDIGTIAVIFTCWLALPIGMLFFPNLLILWLIMGGYAQGSGYVYVFVLLARITAGHEDAAKVTAFMQALSYAICSVGPTLIAIVASDSLEAALYIVFALLVVELFAVLMLTKRSKKFENVEYASK
jgi:CP family cyanate transporter-like MFS transporter